MCHYRCMPTPTDLARLRSEFARGATSEHLAAEWSRLCVDDLRTALAGRTDAQVWVTGSLGRGEALPGSDLDALAVTATPDRGFGALDLPGLRADPNGATPMRRRLRRTPDEWRDAVTRWTADPHEDRGVVMIGLLADARPLEDGPDPDLTDVLTAALRTHPRCLNAVLSDALAHRPHVRPALPLVPAPSVDLKQDLLTPVRKIARWVALAGGTGGHTTGERLDGARPGDLLEPDEITDLRRCHHEILDIVTRRALDGSGGDGPVPLSAFRPAERATIRWVSRTVAGIQRVLDYRLSASSFSRPDRS
ncbi:hypothetical protein F8M49_00625 [Rhodococcus zopfii]|uniref:Polymerase nucleotidyl transferase domain-containing protein n=1 Tax=Rhodococcus zopfii TaxID=43772 RepID=A0ABU3WKH3_9NOCA|nr:hypothetical protein [Rhodococcus zopfii]